MISDYDTLQASIAAWLNRTDLADRIPEFIQLAEAEIRRRLRYTTKRATITIISGSYTLPADVKELRTVRLATGTPGLDRPLLQRSEAALSELRARLVTAGYPRYFSHVGTDLLFVPAPLGAMQAEISYYADITPLSTDSTTNDVLAKAPDAYLWGALQNAEPYLQNDERIPVWKSKFEDALTQLIIERDNAEWGESLIQARLPVVF